jgi:hypothetical protein
MAPAGVYILHGDNGWMLFRDRWMMNNGHDLRMAEMIFFKIQSIQSFNLDIIRHYHFENSTTQQAFILSNRLRSEIIGRRSEDFNSKIALSQLSFQLSTLSYPSMSAKIIHSIFSSTIFCNSPLFSDHCPSFY